MLRPKAKTLPDDALIPKENLVLPRPKKFTHELRRNEPFFFDRLHDAKPRGELPRGTRVVLMERRQGRYCRVVDERGLYVEIDCDSLVAL
jgi:hypothetical protein